MNPDSGDIQPFESMELAKEQGYVVPLTKGEVVRIKDGYFRITGIDHQGNMINLRGIPKEEAIAELKLSELTEEVK